MEALQITKLQTNSKTVVGAINELYNKIQTSNAGVFTIGALTKQSSSEEILAAIGGNWDNFVSAVNSDNILIYSSQSEVNQIAIVTGIQSNIVTFATLSNFGDNDIKMNIYQVSNTDGTYQVSITEYSMPTGNPATLVTTSKNVIGAINELYNSLSAQTNVYKIASLASGMQSEQIETAIGGWDNFIEAISDKRVIIMYKGQNTYVMTSHTNHTTLVILSYIDTTSGNTNQAIKKVNIALTKTSSATNITVTETLINTEDITKLQTDTKNIVGAINEINQKIGTTNELPYVIIKPNNYILLQTLWYEGSGMNNTDILNLFGIESSAADANQKLFDLISSFKDKSLILFKESTTDTSTLLNASALGFIANLDIGETSIELTLNIITGSEYGNDDAPIVCNILFQISTTTASVDTVIGGPILTTSNYQTLKTTNKRIIDAINEINTKLNNIVPIVELTTQIDFSVNNADIELSSGELTSLSKVKDYNQIALSFKQSNTPYKVYSVSKYNNTSGSITSFTFNLSDSSIVGNRSINCSFVLTLTASKAAIKIINLNTVYPILLEGLNKTSPNQTDIQTAIGEFTEIKNAIDTGKNIIALDNYDTYKENIKIIYTKAYSDYILIGIIISNEDFPMNGFIYRIYKILNNYSLYVYDIPVHKAIEFENLKDVTDEPTADEIIGKYSRSELIFAAQNGIPFINKSTAGTIVNRSNLISVSVSNASIMFVYFDVQTSKFYKLLLVPKDEHSYQFGMNQEITF